MNTSEVSPEELDEFLDKRSDVLGSYDLAWQEARERFGVTPPADDVLLDRTSELVPSGPYAQILSVIAGVQYRSELTSVRREIVRASLTKQLTGNEIEKAFGALGARREELTGNDRNSE